MPLGTSVFALHPHVVHRAYTQFQLSAKIFRDPHLINAPERCGLALLNIDTQTLEGIWEAITFDVSSDQVGV